MENPRWQRARIKPALPLNLN